MKGLNPLRKKVLITTDEVIFHAPVDNNPDVRMILQSIVVAEQRFILPALGYELYNTLVNTKNVKVVASNKATLETFINEGRPDDRTPIVLVIGDYINSDEYFNEDQLELWTEHLHKIIAECVYYCALPTNHSRFAKAGVMQESPKTQVGSGGSTTIDLKDLKHLMDRALQDRVNPLIGPLHDYLCYKKYPGYKRDCGCGSDGTPTKVRKTEIITSMYEDDYEEPFYKRPYVPIVDPVVVTEPINETILFENVDKVIINWTAERKLKYGGAGSFQVEVLDNNGQYIVVYCEISPDDIVNTTIYTIDLGGTASGRIIIS